MRRPRPAARAALSSAALAVVLLAAPARAQPDTAAAAPRAPAGVPIGARVEVRTGGGQRVLGTLAAVRSDALVLHVGPGPAPTVWELPSAAIGRLEVWRGRRTRAEGSQRGAMVGLLVGGVPTSLLSAGVYLSERRACRGGGCEDNYFGPHFGTIVVGTLGALLTALTTITGAVVGHNRPGDRWERAPVPRRVGAVIAPAPGGLTVGVRVGR